MRMGLFDARATRFSPAIEKLLAANSTNEAAGAKPVTMAMDAALPSSFDVAIPFAGSERGLAETLSTILQSAGFAV
jgi:hypothetical protein